MPLLSLILTLTGCRGQAMEEPWCEEEEVEIAGSWTWWRDIQPVVAQKCLACHTEGGSASLPLESWEDAWEQRESIRSAVLSRSMPPWQVSDCCGDWYHDYSLTTEEIAQIAAWVDSGAAEGDPGEAPPAPEPIGGLSRVDLSLSPTEAYTPAPPKGRFDDTRCFLMPWPEEEPRFVTGLSPRPGARALAHHIVVSWVPKSQKRALEKLDEASEGPGFACDGGVGDLQVVPLGGSLVGGDYPRGIGNEIPVGATMILQVHYSTRGAPAEPDLTTIDFRLDEEAVAASSIVIANAAWLAAPGMKIKAGDPDAVFTYRFNPSLFIGGRSVDLQGATPHMHRYASRMRILRILPDQSTECLLEIPEWRFGWEQPYWYESPRRLNPEDELYLECHFDNSAANQPNGQEPRDIAWGDNDQDMCAGFLAFTPVEG